MSLGKRKNIVMIFVLLFLTLALSQTFSTIESKEDKKDHSYANNKINDKLYYSGNTRIWNLTGDPILIDDWSPFHNWQRVSSANEWCSGSGTAQDPYLIENVFIDGKNVDTCITIRNSDAYFIVKNCTLYNAGHSKFFLDAGIKLINVRNGLLLNNTCSSNNGCGILQISGSNNNYSNNLVNHNSHHGIYFWFSDNNIIRANEISYNIINGIYFWFSAGNNISENAINYNQNGISLVISNQNRVIKNYIVGNNVSIYQFASQGNIIQENKYEYEPLIPPIDDENEITKEKESDDDKSDKAETEEIPTLSLIVMSATVGILSGGVIGYIIHKKKIQKTGIIPVGKLLKEKPEPDTIKPQAEANKPDVEFGLIPKKAIIKFEDLKKVKEKNNLLKNDLNEHVDQ